MTDKEKLLLLKEILDMHSKLFDYLSEVDLKEYNECVRIGCFPSGRRKFAYRGRLH
ncbi:MAG: hypothetical protein K0Q73_6788 [Paenibacillus sp.]|jgi:hypothetical protein|nr:hypothetical protein [Paenibacillus sp.]